MSKLQLGVFFGSRSCEREVSIISALQMMNHVDTEKYDVVPVYIDQDGAWYTGSALRELRTFAPFHADAKGVENVNLDLTSGSGALLAYRPGKGLFTPAKLEVVARLDVCFLVLHGLHGEDGALQGLLEMANLPYTSTGVVGSAVGMDKIIMKQFFRGAGLPVLPGCWFQRSAFEKNGQSVADQVEKELGYPVFVKPANLGSSIGVSRADNREELMDSLSLAFEYDRRVLVEKGLDRPMELNCSVLGWDAEVEASPIEMPLRPEGDNMLDFKDKYLQGAGASKGMASLSRVLPAQIGEELTGEIQEMSRQIFRMLDCKGVVRIDYMFDKATEKVFITEINTIPGSLAFYLWEAKGVKYPELIDRMVTYARRAHEEKNSRNYAYTSDILKNYAGGSKGAKGAKGSKMT